MRHILLATILLIGCEPSTPDESPRDFIPGPCVSGSWDHDANPRTPCRLWSDCRPGSVLATDGSGSGDRTCDACGPGTFTDTFNAEVCSTFRSCDAGTFIEAEGTVTRDTQCRQCPDGSYSTESNVELCDPWPSCPEGLVVVVPGTRTSVPECGGCEDGTWDDDNDPNTLCVDWTPCPAGTSVGAPGSTTQDQTCEECPVGTWSEAENTPTCSAWTDCQPGFFVSVDASSVADRECEACAPGTISTELNAAACETFVECPDGTIETAPGSGSSPPTCEPCATGTWDQDGNAATACIPWATCAAGDFVEQDGTTTTDRQCSVCEGATFTVAPNTATCAPWSDCAPGTFVGDAGTSTSDRTCVVCEGGTFSDVDNAASCAEWTECPGPVEELGTATSDAVCGDAAVDCVLEDWPDWSACDATCEVGREDRDREVLIPPTDGGLACDLLGETRVCEAVGSCVCPEYDEPVGCEATAGCDWDGTLCVDAPLEVCANEVDEATCLANATGCEWTGVACQYAAADCQVTDFSDFSDCTEVCDGGTRTRTRDVTTYPRGGGAVCPILRETEACNTDPCP